MIIPLLGTDLKEDIAIIAITIFAVSGAFAANSDLDSQVRSAYNQGSGYFSAATPTEDAVTFQRKQVERINSISEDSIGYNPVGDERLYCLEMNGGNVTEVSFIQDISKSEKGAISGTCYSNTPGGVDAILHTHPQYGDRLSQEDKTLNNPREYTCLQYDRITESFSGEVGGLKCWKINGYYLDPEFEEVEVVIQ